MSWTRTTDFIASGIFVALVGVFIMLVVHAKASDWAREARTATNAANALGVTCEPFEVHTPIDGTCRMLWCKQVNGRDGTAVLVGCAP